jgi:hypothetical protein
MTHDTRRAYDALYALPCHTTATRHVLHVVISAATATGWVPARFYRHLQAYGEADLGAAWATLTLACAANLESVNCSPPPQQGRGCLQGHCDSVGVHNSRISPHQIMPALFTLSDVTTPRQFQRSSDHQSSEVRERRACWAPCPVPEGDAGFERECDV